MRLILCLTLTLAACGGEGEGEVVWVCTCDPEDEGWPQESECLPEGATRHDAEDLMCHICDGSACECSIDERSGCGD